MEAWVLKAANLTKQYHNTKALDGLNLELPKGKIIGLLGPNGSGKTTFIKLAAGLLTPSQGNLQVCGENIGVQTKARISTQILTASGRRKCWRLWAFPRMPDSAPFPRAIRRRCSWCW